MDYRGIRIYAEGETLELVADAMWSVGAEGVSVSDGTEMQDAGKWDYADASIAEPKPTYAEFFVEAENAEAKKDELERFLGNVYGINATAVLGAPFSGDDWFNNWKTFYKEQHAGKFNIVPDWLVPEFPESPYNIFIEPGMAFGTGEHASTRLCLSLMSDVDFGGKTAVDVGTGSGILGIAAAKAGADSVYMCDIEEEAVAAAASAAVKNGVSAVTRVEKADLASGYSGEKADVVTANLTADLLEMLLKDIERILKKGGTVVTSGIIVSRRDEVVNAFSEAGLSFSEEKREGDWCAVKFVKA